MASLLLVAAVAVPVLAHVGNDPRPGATKWDLETRITDTSKAEGGLNPSVAADSHRTIFATAGLQTLASPDLSGSLPVRVSPWLWSSIDHGKTWKDVPLTPLSATSRLPALESDVMVTGSDVLVLAQTAIGVTRISRWQAGPHGELTALGDTTVNTFTTPGTFPRQRPQLAATGRGGVVLLENGVAGWRVHRSTDSGASFAQPVDLDGATSCTLGGQPRASAGSAMHLVVGCSSIDNRWLAFTSADGGASFRKADLGPATSGTADIEPPAATVAADGTPYLLTMDAAPGGSKLRLWSSRGGGAWSSRDITDGPGKYAHAQLASASHGLLGIVVHREDDIGRWFVLGAAFQSNGPVYLVSFASHSPVSVGMTPPGDAVDATFDIEQRLSLVWTIRRDDLVAPAVTTQNPQSDVWFVRSRVPNPLAAAPAIEPSTTGALPVCRVRGQVTRHASWDLIRGPVWRERNQGAGQRVTAYAVDAFHPATVTVTNGTSVARSEDAGCTWREVWSLEDQPDSFGRSSGTSSVSQLVSPRSRLESGSVWVVLSGPAGGPSVLRSRNGAPGTFVEASSGLPPAGGAPRLVVAAGNPDFAYLSTSPTGVFGGLYATDDGGLTWTQRTPPGLKPVPTITALTVDPLGPNGVWGVLDGALAHSSDGGRNFTAPTLPPALQSSSPGPVTAVDVWHVAGDAAKVLAYAGPLGGENAHVYSSADDGRTWTDDVERGIEGVVESVTRGSRPDVIVVGTQPQGADGSRIYHLHLEDGDYDAFAPADLLLPGNPGVTSDARAHPTFYGLAAAGLIRYAGDQVEPGPPADLPVPRAVVEASRGLDPLGLSVIDHLTLSVGASAKVTVAMSVLPRAPRADLFLLTDTSESMRTALPRVTSAFAQGVHLLAAQGIDVWAGVGHYKTDREPPRYRRDRDIAPPGASLSQQLETLSANSGAGLETQLIALRQVVTGDGLDQCTPLGCLRSPIGSICEADPTATGCSIKPGQQADFRAGTVKIVLHATDTGFRNPEGTPRNAAGLPDLVGVADLFRRAGVLVVGYDASPAESMDRPIAHEDLSTMAVGSRALAPRNGLDCDGDGSRSGVEDAKPGAPAVCSVASGKALATLLADVIRAALGSASFKATITDPAVGQRQLASAPVDLTAGMQRSVTVSVGCTEPGRRTVEVHAGLAHPTVPVPAPAERSIIVDCLAPTTPSVDQPGRVIAGALAPVVAVQPPVQPVAQQQLQSQAQTQTQGAPAAAVSEREEAAVGIVGAGDELPHGEEPVPQTLAMSGRSDTEALRSLALIGAAAALGSALAVRQARREVRVLPDRVT